MSIEELHRQHYGRILASLIRTVRDISLAEDCLQEAFALAIKRWPVEGTPANPAGWLMTTARHKAIDHIRHHTMADAKHQDMVALSSPAASTPEPVDTLRLIFTCCHPAIALENRIALTLRTVCGLSVEEIARAFLVPPATLSQRLVRAKTKIKLAGIPYEVPADDELAERLSAALHVIYLVFNEGYSSTVGAQLTRADLSAEAIRLCRQLRELLPDEREVAGLLALMLLNDSRRSARMDTDGNLVLLEHQDRSRWDRALISEGTQLVPFSMGGGPGPYAIQAAIAALHCNAPTSEQTDWPQIAALYTILGRQIPSPVIELNRAVAVAMAEGPAVGLELIEKISLPGYHRLPATKADLLRRLGRNREAIAAYREALSLVSNEIERRFLEQRLAELQRS